ncbi:MAG: homocysteine S-methyltransferase family protein [Gemmataceae bacterium]|nr:homocysteine S-methyltransferase family protein [Gemmataceae bacterium]
MPRLMDAAMGTALLGQGIDPLLAPLTHPRAVAAIHASHREAGAEALLTATFQANPATVGDRLEELGRAAVRLARSSRSALVLGDAGPMGWPREFPDWDALKLTLDALDGADALLLETCSTPQALEASAFAFHRAGWEEVWLSLAYHRVEGRVVSFSGHGPEVFARHAARHGVAALGVNCGKGLSMDDIAEVLRVYAENTSLPLFARPNADAGEPGPLPGAAWVGGCCGTDADWLRRMKG